MKPDDLPKFVSVFNGKDWVTVPAEYGAVPIEDLPSSYSLKTPDVEIVQISTPWKNVDLVSKYGPLILDDMAGGVIEAGETTSPFDYCDIIAHDPDPLAIDIGPFECRERTW